MFKTRYDFIFADGKIITVKTKDAKKADNLRHE